MEATALEQKQLRYKDVSGKIFWAIVIVHVGALAALVPGFFSWPAFVFFLVMIPVTAWFGITFGYHRLLTHASFQTKPWIKYLSVICGSMTLEGPVLTWVEKHRYHHKYTDKNGDPHTPRHGRIWAHVWWAFCKYFVVEEDQLVRKVDVIGDLRGDKVLERLSRYHYIPAFLMVPISYAFGEALHTYGDLNTSGVSFVVWGVFVRTVVVYHGTWCVNSVCHISGTTNFDILDDSKNSWWVALITGGEGWHNNHHAFPSSADHGLRWYEFDPTGRFIKVLSWKRIGLAWAVQTIDNLEEKLATRSVELKVG